MKSLETPIGVILGSPLGRPLNEQVTEGAPPVGADNVVTVGTQVTKSATNYGFRDGVIGTCAPGDTAFNDGTVTIDEFYYTTASGRLVLIVSGIALSDSDASAFVSVDVDGNSYARSDREDFTDLGGNQYRWRWGTFVTNPFGTTNGVEKDVNWTL